MNAKHYVLLGVALVVGALIGYNLAPSAPLGKIVENLKVSFDAGIAVKGTSVLDANRNLENIVNITNTGTSTLVLVKVDRLQFGGGKTTDTTSTSTLTLTAAQVCDNTMIEWTAVAAKSTTSLPTATNLVADCMAENGSYKFLRIKNLGDAASSSFLLDRISTGLNLVFASSSGADASSTMAGGTWADLHFIRASSTQIDVGVGIYEK